MVEYCLLSGGEKKLYLIITIKMPHCYLNLWPEHQVFIW